MCRPDGLARDDPKPSSSSSASETTTTTTTTPSNGAVARHAGGGARAPLKHNGHHDAQPDAATDKKLAGGEAANGEGAARAAPDARAASFSSPPPTPVFDALVRRPLELVKFFGLDPRRTRFRAHRVGGAAFLVSYACAWACFALDYDRFVRTRLAILPALIGLFQAVSAALTFRFLPNDENSGYFSDKGVLSRAFVRENVFYQLQTSFGAAWYTLGNDVLERTVIGKCLVLTFAFLPFVVLRPWFPTTRFTTTHRTKTRYRSENLKAFYYTGAELIRYFYLYGKHVMGFGFNFLFFLGRIDDRDMKTWGVPLLLLNTGTVSIAVFLHTLRFKKLMKPRHSFLIYLAMAYASFLAVPPLSLKLAKNPLVLYLVVQGIVVNLNVRYGWRKLMHVHYVAAMLVLLRQRRVDGNCFFFA